MNCQNYKKVLKLLGTDKVYHYDNGSGSSYKKRTKIDEDNSTGKAACVLEHIVDYVDAILCEMDALELAETTGEAAFLIGDERFVLIMNRMAADAVEKDWEDWAVMCERILHAKQIRIEYSFGECAYEAKELIGEGVAKALEDLLEGGRLADCVTVCSQRETIGISDYGNGLEGHYLRCLWMNGMHNGEYVCGEVPFEQSEQKIRHCGGWRQANFFDDEYSGLKISLHPDTNPALIQRLRRSTKEFEREINCYCRHERSFIFTVICTPRAARSSFRSRCPTSCASSYSTSHT